jgi:uncharacterized membrane protein
MVNILNAVLVTIAFFLLSPGQFLRIPQKGSKLTVMLVHSIVFFIVFIILNMFTKNMQEGVEGRGYKTRPGRR